MCHCLNYPLISGRVSEHFILSFLFILLFFFRFVPSLYHVKWLFTCIFKNKIHATLSACKIMLTRNNHSERWLNYCTSLASQTTGAWLLPLRWRQPGDVANCSCQRCKQSQYYSPQRCSDWTHQSRCTGNRYKNIYLSTQWLKSKYSKKNSLLLVIITIKNWQHEIVFFFYKCT